MSEKKPQNSLAEAIQAQLKSDVPTNNSVAKPKKISTSADALQQLLDGKKPIEKLKKSDQEPTQQKSPADKDEAVKRLKERFEEKRQELENKRKTNESKKSDSSKQQKKAAPKKPVEKPKPSVKKPTDKKPEPKQDKKQPPKETKPTNKQVNKSAEKPAPKSEEKKETPAERLRRVLAERQAEKDAENKKKDKDKNDAETAKVDEEEEKKQRYEIARKMAEEEINAKYAQKEQEKANTEPAEPPKSMADLPKKPSLKEKVQTLWDFLTNSRLGRYIRSMLQFYQRMGAVLIWTIAIFVAGRFALEYLVNIDLFSLSQWHAIKVLYTKYYVPNNVVLGLAGLSIIWLVGASIFYRKGWPWVKPIYMFLLQLAAMPIGLGLFVLFVTLLLTNHVWGKLQSV